MTSFQLAVRLPSQRQDDPVDYFMLEYRERGSQRDWVRLADRVSPLWLVLIPAVEHLTNVYVCSVKGVSVVCCAYVGVGDML